MGKQNNNISWGNMVKPAKDFVIATTTFIVLTAGAILSGQLADENAAKIAEYQTANESYVNTAFEQNPEASIKFVENVMSAVENNKKTTIKQQDLEDFVTDNGYVTPNTAHKMEVNNNHIQELKQDSAGAVNWFFKLGAAATGFVTALKGVGLGKYLNDKSKEELGE